MDLGKVFVKKQDVNAMKNSKMHTGLLGYFSITSPSSPLLTAGLLGMLSLIGGKERAVTERKKAVTKKGDTNIYRCYSSCYVLRSSAQ